MEPARIGQGRRRYRRGSAVVWIGLILVTLAATITLVLRLPLGLSEAAELAPLERLIDAADVSLGAFQRACLAVWVAGRPALSLTLSALLFRAVPGLDMLIALRLPDALAAIGLVGLVYRIAGAGEVGVAAGLWTLVAAVIGIGWIAPPGAIFDQAAAVIIFAAYRAHAHGRTRGPALLALAAGVAALAANGAGVYAMAPVAGLWLYRGLSDHDWRALGSHRFTALGASFVAGLTLTNTLGLPRLAPFAELYRQLAEPLSYDGVSIVWLGGFAGWAALAAPAFRVISTRFDGGAARHGLIVVIGALILATAGNTAPVDFVCLAPFVALWLIAPVLSRARTKPPWRWPWLLYMLVFGAQALILAVWSLVGNADSDVSPLAWAIAVAVAALVAASVATGVQARSSSAPPNAARPIAVAALALAIALIGVFDQPRRIAPQRVFDHALAATMRVFENHPIAALAPVRTTLWRAELGRPVFTAPSRAALCDWASTAPGRRRPIALVAVAATPGLLRRFPGARLELQSPGTRTRSVMAMSLERPSRQTCAHAWDGKPGQTG